MDILTVEGWPHEEVLKAIAANEKKYPSFIAENQLFKMVDTSDDKKWAAMISSCRSDPHNCGRCAMWQLMRDKLRAS